MMITKITNKSSLAILSVFFIFFLLANNVSAQITIHSPENKTYYQTNETFLNATEIEASPDVLWYAFPNEEWLTFQVDSNNTGYTNNFNPPNLTRVWNTYLGSSFIISSPAVYDGVIYVGSDDDKIYALYLNGTIKWSYQTGDNVRSDPTVYNGIVYVGSDDGDLYALYTDNGTLKFKYTQALNNINSQTFYNGVIYAGSDDDKIHSINATTGSQIWTYTTGDNIRSTPAVYDGVVYVGSDDDKIYAIYTNGTLKWNYTTGGNVRSPPTIYNNMIYVGSYDDHLYALYLNGTQKWNYTSAWLRTESSTAIYDDIIYLTFWTKMHSIYANNGTFKWERTFGSSTYITSPTISDDIIYLGCVDNRIYALYLNGTIKWSYLTTTDVDASPSISSGMIHLGSYAFADASTTNSLERNFTLPYGTHTIQVISRNTTGGIDQEFVTFTLSTEAPPVIFITYEPPYNTTYYTTDTVDFNVTISVDGDTCYVDWGFGNFTMINSTGNWHYSNSSMAEGTFTPIFWCNSTQGKSNSTIGNTFTVEEMGERSIFQQLPSITGFMAVTTGFGVIGLFAVLTFYAMIRTTTTPKDFIRMLIGIIIIIFILAGVYVSIIT